MEISLFGPSPVEDMYSLNALMGKQFPLSKFFHAYLFTGLGATWGILRGNILIEERDREWYADNVYNTEHLASPSIPIEAELLFKPIKYAQLGLNLFGNINFKRPFYGIALKAGVGKVR